MIGEKLNNIETIDITNLHQPETLSKRVVRGGIWVFALRITDRGLGFIRTVILARLLVPEDFGLLGIAMLAIATLETFSQTGVQVALIQKKEDVKLYLDTACNASTIKVIAKTRSSREFSMRSSRDLIVKSGYLSHLYSMAHSLALFTTFQERSLK